MADSDVGKLFVGGISRDTSDATIRDHFTKYGEISSSIIAKDRVTGVPRGFGFVTFFDPSSVDKALLDHHVIGGRTVEVKKAIPRNEQLTNSQREQQQQQSPLQQQFYQIHPQGIKGSGRNSNGSYGSSNGDQYLSTKKIFVGGLSANLTEEEFKTYFEKFGRITDVVVMHDNNTNRPRGFGFITFDSEEVVENIMQKSHHELAGKRVEVKRAVPRDATKNSNNGSSSRYNGGRFSPVPGYKDDNYSARGPRYGSYPSQAPVATTYPGFYYNGVYGGGYPVGGCGFYGYGMPLVAPQSLWNGFGMMGVRPVAYGTGYYPTNVNGGVAMMGMVNPYNNILEPIANGKPNQDFGGNNQVPTKDATIPMSGARSDVDASSLKSGKGVVNVKKNSRIPDAQAQLKVAPVSQS